MTKTLGVVLLCGAALFVSSARADDVRAQIAACHRPLAAARRSVAVIGGGVGPANAAVQLEQAGVAQGVMLLLGSAAYEDGSPADAVRSVVESVSSRPKNELESA